MSRRIPRPPLRSASVARQDPLSRFGNCLSCGSLGAEVLAVITRCPNSACRYFDVRRALVAGFAHERLEFDADAGTFRRQVVIGGFGPGGWGTTP